MEYPKLWLQCLECRKLEGDIFKVQRKEERENCRSDKNEPQNCSVRWRNIHLPNGSSEMKNSKVYIGYPDDATHEIRARSNKETDGLGDCIQSSRRMRVL